MPSASAHDSGVLSPDDVVVHGCARGADRLADAAARELGLAVERYPYIGALGRAGPGCWGQDRGCVVSAEALERAAHHLRCGWLAQREAGSDRAEATSINRRLCELIGQEDDYDWSAPRRDVDRRILHWVPPEDRLPSEWFYERPDVPKDLRHYECQEWWGRHD